MQNADELAAIENIVSDEIIIERITAEQRELCPISPRCYYMASLSDGPHYVVGKSPNEARKRLLSFNERRQRGPNPTTHPYSSPNLHLSSRFARQSLAATLEAPPSSPIMAFSRSGAKIIIYLRNINK